MRIVSGTATTLLGALFVQGPLSWSYPAQASEPPSTPTPPIVFALPSTNQAVFETEGEPRFFAPTPGREWTSGTYGCVRTGGFQFHEGLDILWTDRDRKREPLDPILASADGEVVYINTHPWSSLYGNYIVLKHRIEAMEVYTLYAHLSEIEPDLRVGGTVTAGTPIAIMGRTASTQQRIAHDRAHVHFEITLLLTPRYDDWHKKKYQDGVNEHGNWNGLALIGLDGWAILREQQELGPRFSLLRHLRQQTDLCRVWIAEPQLDWLKRHPGLLRPNPLAQREGIAGYEVALNYAGIPFELTPRAASEAGHLEPFQLLSVNAAEARDKPCKKFLQFKNGRWQLTGRGLEHLKLLTF